MATEILIDGIIGTGPGEISSRWFRSQLPGSGQPVAIRIHSEGGSLFEALAIFDILKAHNGRKTAVVESVALSAASVILCAVDSAKVTPNGYVMIHSPYMEDDELSPGETALLSSLRQRLVSIYSAKTGKPQSAIAQLLDAETFFDAEAAVDLGIVQGIHRTAGVLARRIPAAVLARLRSPSRPAKTIWREKVQARMAAGLTFQRAISAVAKANPKLRARLVEEANRR